MPHTFSNTMNARSKAEAFLKIAPQFRLGKLETEKPHPKTTELSFLVKNNLQKAIATLKEIDILALQVAKSRAAEIIRMKNDIESTFRNGHKVYLVGCGATGRLSLVLEVLWRKEKAGKDLENSVISLMAGGDTALIRSIEGFEDFPAFAARHLGQLAFSDGDMLIACTEGGETPFVIGAAEYACEISTVPSYFLYCNPDEILSGLTERTTNILNNKAVKRINLSTGPMALSGSTRMQASTVLMYAVGLALLNAFNEVSIETDVSNFSDYLSHLDYDFLEKFIEKEYNIYSKGGYLTYLTNDDPGISILTDTTERSPTFTLDPFNNYLKPEQKPSLVYLCMPDSADSAAAWESLLFRTPRPLNWSEFPVTMNNYLLGFDFSLEGLNKRKEKVHPAECDVFRINRTRGYLVFSLQDKNHSINLEKLTLLHQHLLLKMLLNILSTLIMGKLGRYESNLMTYVTPGNNKLIDRAARYTDILLKREGVADITYSDIIYALFEEMEYGTGTRSLVLDTVDRIRKGKK
jgi:N-acetylmuramic acid 6-phosphate etherase